MKHTVPVSAVLLAMFLAAQFIGLFILNSSIDIEASKIASEQAGKLVLRYEDLPVFERPQIEPGVSFLYLGAAIIIGTVLLLLIVRFRKVFLWKVWFLFAILITL